MKCSSMRVVEKSTIMNVTTWVSLIMRCVQTLSFSILVNGFPRDVFCPYRGLKQCDHLSPYLFILCAVVLSTLIIKADEQGSLHGLRICPYAFFYFTLVFFANDNIVFSRATKREATILFNILKKYEDILRQKCRSKCLWCFDDDHDDLMQMMQMGFSSLYSRQ